MYERAYKKSATIKFRISREQKRAIKEVAEDNKIKVSYLIINSIMKMYGTQINLRMEKNHE